MDFFLEGIKQVTEFMLVVIGWLCGFLTGWYYGDKGNA